MKQRTLQSEFNALPEKSRYFLSRWKEEKGYPLTPEWDFGQLLELYFALTNDLRFETSVDARRGDDVGMFFNNVFDKGEIVLAWDGTQPIDILFFKLNTDLKTKIIQASFISSSV